VDWRSRLLLAAGIIFALGAGFVAYVVLVRVTAPPPTATVVVAAVDIPERTLITAGEVNRLIAARQVPSSQVPAGALTDPQQAVGRATKERLAEGVVLVDSKLLVQVASSAAPGLAAVLPHDYVGMAVPVSDLNSVAGAIRPDDRVDLIVTMAARPTNGPAYPVTHMLMQDVRVLSVGLWVENKDSAPDRYSMVTLVVTRQQAAELQYLVNTDAKLSLALRRFDDTDENPIQPITSEYFSKRFGLSVPISADFPTPVPATSTPLPLPTPTASP